MSAPTPPEIRIAEDGWVAARLGADVRFAALLAAPAAHRVQIVVGELDGDAGQPRLRAHAYRLDAEYFFAASAIKTFASVAALRKVAALEREGVALDTPLSLCTRDERCRTDEDPSNRDGRAITLGHEIRKMHLASDNRAFNRLYDFVGPRELEDDLRALGFSSLRIRHRMGELWTLGARTPRMELHREGEPFVVRARGHDLADAPTDVPGVRVGHAHIDFERGRVDEPRDFSRKNYVSLADLFRLSVALVRPDLPGAPALGLTAAHRAFLLQAMSEDPADSENPTFRGARWAGHPQKPMYPGVARVVPEEHVRYVGKAGRAYGFHVDSAYVEDRRTGRAFFVTAGLYADKDGVVGDDRYDYDAVTRPFFVALGEILAEDLLGAPTPGPSSRTTSPP